MNLGLRLPLMSVLMLLIATTVAPAEKIVLLGGTTLDGTILKENAATIFVDLGYDVLVVPPSL